MKTPRPVLLRGLLVVALAAAGIPLLALSEYDLMARRLAGRITTDQRYYMPPAPVIRAATFGYNELVADILWVKAIAYFGDHAFVDHDLRFLKRHLDNILAADARFKAVYRYGASMLMSKAEHQTNADVWDAIDLLKRAHKLYPDEYVFPLHLGTYYMSELKTKNKAQRRRWRHIGADWIRRASLVGANVPWLPTLASKIYSEQGKRELAIHHLKELYLVAADEDTKQQIAGRLRALQAAHLAEELRQEAQSFAEARRRSQVPFVSPDLFALLRQRPLAPVSLERLLVSKEPGAAPASAPASAPSR